MVTLTTVLFDPLTLNLAAVGDPEQTRPSAVGQVTTPAELTETVAGAAPVIANATARALVAPSARALRRTDARRPGRDRLELRCMVDLLE